MAVHFHCFNTVTTTTASVAARNGSQLDSLSVLWIDLKHVRIAQSSSIVSGEGGIVVLVVGGGGGVRGALDCQESLVLLRPLFVLPPPSSEAGLVLSRIMSYHQDRFNFTVIDIDAAVLGLKALCTSL